MSFFNKALIGYAFLKNKKILNCLQSIKLSIGFAILRL